MTAHDRHNHTTVIVLGAGASAADGAPVQSALLPEYFRDAEIQARVQGEMNDALRRYFRDVWGVNTGGDLATAKFPTFEEALGLLDIAESRRELFRGMGDDPHVTGMQELRNHLINLIALILEKKLRGPCPFHHQLVCHLQEDGQLRSTVFISLNYDIIVDNAIERVSSYEGEHRVPDYGVTFKPELRGLIGSTLLLKLHGSLNWSHCPTCNTLSLSPGHKIAAELPGAPRHFRCHECRGLQVQIIVPPTFFKVMSNFYLQQIWNRAEEELKQAERIIFCGYSFPDADMHVKYLLKRAEVNRMGVPPDMFIVNEHEGKENQQRNAEKERYMRFFWQKDRVHWTDLSFQEFAAEPQLIEDQTRWQ